MVFMFAKFVLIRFRRLHLCITIIYLVKIFLGKKRYIKQKYNYFLQLGPKKKKQRENVLSKKVVSRVLNTKKYSHEKRDFRE